jgi:methylmalonyl-CoA/ethylmalonyl-CoA epimerase
VADTLPEKLGGRTMRVFEEGACMQVAMVVRDIEDSIRKHSQIFGIGPWDVYDFDASVVKNYIYRGKPATHKCIIAIAWSGDTQLELMQPVSGYSIYDEFLDKHGEGMHHIKLYYKDVHKAARDFEARGYPVIQSGLFDEDQHYYLDTEKDFGYIIELGNAGRVPPAQRRLG